MRKLRSSELGRLSSEEYTASEKTPLILVLDNIRSMHNVGSIFRTADCFRVAHIYLCGLTPIPGHSEIEKTALGATESVDWSHNESTMTCLKELRKEGHRIAALEQAERSIDLRDYTLVNFLNLLINNRYYKKNKFVKSLLVNFIELFFLKEYKLSKTKKSLLIFYHNFINKIHNTEKFNLDEESLFLEFKSKLLNA